ncbi:unnamed protein product [Caenorhabditis bovis]|uniref:Probable arginine--tRNA ligase, mitochondrial n=1 Tax=Caenorhabditis bovis TaxID=2654633 RepID=A0A8S1FBD1_9PELO|nr:unnamed protein product [Caenorhabditis bovis]
MNAEVSVQMLQHLRRPGALKALFQKQEKASQKRICIDYSSPNIAKRFHIGNLRSTLIGRYLDTTNRLIGNAVTSVNYLGDWGNQFAMISVFWPQMRPSDQYWKGLSDEEKIKMLTDCYVIANKNMKTDEDFRNAVHQQFIEMENAMLVGNASADCFKLWGQIREISMKHLKEFYTMFDVKFDRYMHESSRVRMAHKIVQDLIDKKIVENLDGRLIVNTGDKNNDKDNGYAIVRKSNSTSLYLTREIAAVLERDDFFKADKYLYVVDRAQRQHFRALKIILEKMGKEDLAEKVEHVQYGRVRGLSTRNGRTEAISKVLSISTVIFNELKRARNSEYEFSFQNAFALNQNNALALQIKHSRLSSIETKNEHLLPFVDECKEFPRVDVNDDVKKLVFLLEQVEKSIETSIEKFEPCQLTVQLIQIAQTVATVQNQLRVRDQPTDIAVPRYLLFSATRNVLAEGMKLLGMTPARNM